MILKQITDKTRIYYDYLGGTNEVQVTITTEKQLSDKFKKKLQKLVLKYGCKDFKK
jgi:hypothetical protein